MALPLLLNPIGIVAITVSSAEATTVIELAILAAIVLVVVTVDYANFLMAYAPYKVLTLARVLVLEHLLGIMPAEL